MKKTILWFILAGIFLDSGKVFANCRIPDYAAITVQRTEIIFEFAWDESKGPIGCEEGTAVEFEVMIWNEPSDPQDEDSGQKCFAAPLDGRDDDKERAELRGFIGYTDVWNYFFDYSPSKIKQHIENNCGYFNLPAAALADIRDWFKPVEDHIAHFAVGTRDPQKFSTVASTEPNRFVPAKEEMYSFTYPLEIPSQNPDGKSCDFLGADWGYVTIKMQVMPNICWLSIPLGGTHMYTCPHLIGFKKCLGENPEGVHLPLLNRLCVPTSKVEFVPGEYESDGTECVDEDEDDIFALQWDSEENCIPMFGSNVGDCNDGDSDLGVCFPLLDSPADGNNLLVGGNAIFSWTSEVPCKHTLRIRRNPPMGPLVINQEFDVDIIGYKVSGSVLDVPGHYQWTVCYPGFQCSDDACCAEVRTFTVESRKIPECSPEIEEVIPQYACPGDDFEFNLFGSCLKRDIETDQIRVHIDDVELTNVNLIGDSFVEASAHVWDGAMPGPRVVIYANSDSEVTVADGLFEILGSEECEETPPSCPPCPDTDYGEWSACGGFANTCDETGTRQRMATHYECMAEAGVCFSYSVSETEPCSRDTDGISCGGSGAMCVNSECVPECVPDCAGKECGDDGCEGTCGTCTGCASECVNSFCQAISFASYACYNDSVWWFDSCLMPESVKEDCVAVGMICGWDATAGEYSCIGVDQSPSGTILFPSESSVVEGTFQVVVEAVDDVAVQTATVQITNGPELVFEDSSSPGVPNVSWSTSSVNISNWEAGTFYAALWLSDGVNEPMEADTVTFEWESGVCTPVTCTQLAVSCGTWDDNCGGTLNCGDCTPGQECQSGQCVGDAFCPGYTGTNTCCYPDDPCNWAGDGYCDCDDTCPWDSVDCDCIPDCAGKECGNDGCGGSCGTCSADETCDDGQCVPDSTCTDVYIANQSTSCYINNPSGATVCLTVDQVNGASWRYQICKQGALFEYAFSHRLEDLHYPAEVFYTHFEVSDIQCNDWTNIDLSYISGYGPSSGALLVAYILSPPTCVDPSCEFNTGTDVTVRLECQ